MDQVGVLADGTLFHWSNNSITYYGENAVKQIEGGKKEQELMEGHNGGTYLCVYKWQDRMTNFAQILVK